MQVDVLAIAAIGTPAVHIHLVDIVVLCLGFQRDRQAIPLAFVSAASTADASRE